MNNLIRGVMALALVVAADVPALALDLAGADHTVTETELANNEPFTNTSETLATLTFDLSADATYSGTISGSVKVKKTGSSTLTLTTAGTYTGGTEISGGAKGAQSILLVENGEALGTGEVDLPSGWGQLRLAASVRIANEVDLAGGSSTASSQQPHLYLNDGATLAGPLVLKRAGVNNATHPFCGNGTVFIDGEIRAGDSYNSVLRISLDDASARVRIRQAINCPNLTVNCQDKGSVWLEASGNSFAAINVNGGNSPVHATVAEAFSTTATIGYGGGSGANSCVCLDGHDQTIAKIHYKDYTTSTPGTITSTNAPATLAVSGDADSLVRARLNGMLSLCFNPPSSERTLTIDGNNAAKYLNTMSGMLMVSNGVVTATTVTFTALSGITVADGATFAPSAATVLNALSVLDLATGATLSVPEGLQIATDRLLVNGVSKAMGVVYVSKENPDPPADAVALDEISGNGSVYVNVKEIKTVESSWTGEAGDDLATLSKWNPAITADDLTSGGLVATFAGTGGSAVFSSDIVFKKIAFSAAEGETTGFTLSARSGATLTLRENGLAISGSGTYRIDAPVLLLADQTWAFPAAGGATLVVTGDISAPSQDYGIGFTGSADVELTGANSSFEGSVTVSNGTLRATGAYALGRGSSRSVVQIWPGEVVLDGVRLEKPYEMTGNKGGSASPPVILTVTNDVVFSEQFSNTYACGLRLSPAATLALDGGTSLAAYFKLDGAADSVYYATNAPLRANGATQIVTDGRFVAGVATNELFRSGNLASLFFVGGVFETTVPDALATTNALLQLRLSGGTLDLCGNDQSCGGLNPDQYGGDVNSIITSATPATLTVAQWTDHPYRGDITGQAGLVKLGSATLTLSKAVSSTGAVSVRDGCLAFDETGSWLETPSVTVSGSSARISLSGKAFGRKVKLAVTDGGTVEIAAGVVQRVSEYWYNGKRIGGGVYTAADNVGISGGGSLRVSGCGCAVIIR